MPFFLLNGEVIWQTNDYPLSKELHAGGNQDWWSICWSVASHVLPMVIRAFRLR